MTRERAPYVAEAAVMLLLVALVALGTTVGFVVGRDAKTSSSTTSTTPGHVGANLSAADFGDPAAGAKLFVSKGCADCHSYGGQGGKDAPPLDFMAGHLSARDVANMSGRIWNHLPAMLMHFKQEGLPVPTFQDDEMANLIAFLHSANGAAPSDTGS